MPRSRGREAKYVCLIILTSIVAQATNLPDVPPGVFNVSTALEIRTTTSAAWDALTNFPAYSSWNPFCRSAVVVTQLNESVAEQYPVENRRLILRTQIPPLPLPVDSDTPDDPLNTQFAYENITHVQPDLLRVAWAYAATPEDVLAGERWQALSDTGSGMVLYEAREVFHGALATTLRDLYGTGLQEGFDAQAQGLKLLLEGQ